MSNKRTKTLFKPAGSVPCGGFVSFSDVVTPSHIEGDILRNASHLSPIYRGSDSDLAVAAKKMIKKDVTTKLKAFHEVISIIKDETKGHVLLTDFLPYFAHIFPRIVMENDRKVRETLFAVLIAVIEVDKTSLTPFMTHIIGHWWISTADICAEVKSAAQRAFEQAIPPKKREPVLLHLSSSIISLMASHLVCKPETLSDMSTTSQEDAAERFERVLVSTISSIGKFISFLSGPERLKLFESGDDDVEEGEKLEGKGMGLCHVFTSSLWKKASAKKLNIRRAVYSLVMTTIANLPEAISQDNALKIATALLTSLVDEEDPNTVSLILDTFLTVMTAYPAAWVSISINDLLRSLRKQLSLCPLVIVQSLLAIIGCIPTSMVSTLSSHQSLHSTVPQIKGNKKDKKKEETEIDSKSSDITYTHDILCTFVEEVSLLSENPDLSQHLTILIDLFVAELSLVLLLRKDSTGVKNDEEKTKIDNLMVERRRMRLFSFLIDGFALSFSNLSSSDDYIEEKAAFKRALGQLIACCNRDDTYIVSSNVWDPLLRKIAEAIIIFSGKEEENKVNSFSKSIEFLVDVVGTSSGSNVTSALLCIPQRLMESIRIDNSIVSCELLGVAYSKLKSLLPCPLLSIVKTMIDAWKESYSSSVFMAIPLCDLIEIERIECIDNCLYACLGDTGILRAVNDVIAFIVKLQENEIETILRKTYVNDSLAIWIKKCLSMLVSDDDKQLPLIRTLEFPDTIVFCSLCFSSSILMKNTLCVDVLMTTIASGCLSTSARWGVLSSAAQAFRSNAIPIVNNDKLIDILVASFYGRNRDFKKEKNTNIYVITSWSEIRYHLLPLLPLSMKSDLGDRLIVSLAESLVTADIQPRKWARHLCGFLSLLTSRQAVLSQIDSSNLQEGLLISLGLLDSAYYWQVVDDLLEQKDVVLTRERVVRFFDCLVQFRILWKGYDDDTHLDDAVMISSDTVEPLVLSVLAESSISLYLVVLVIFQLLPKDECESVHRVQRHILNMFSTLNIVESHHIANMLMQYSLCESDGKFKRYEVYKAIVCALNALYDSTENVQLDPVPLALSCLISNESFAKNARILYIELGSSSIRATQGLIVDIHEQIGEETFFTVSLASGRELQTEANRLLSQAVVTIQDVFVDQLIVAKDVKDTFEAFRCTIRGEKSSITYLKTVIIELLLESTSISESSSLKQAFLCFLISKLGSLKTELHREEGTTDLLGLLRGYILSLLSESCDICFGLNLLEAVCSSKWGMGNGIWLLPVYRRIDFLRNSEISEFSPTDIFSLSTSRGHKSSNSVSGASRLISDDICAASPALVTTLASTLSSMAAFFNTPSTQSMLLEFLPTLIATFEADRSNKSLLSTILRSYLTILSSVHTAPLPAMVQKFASRIIGIAIDSIIDLQLGDNLNDQKVKAISVLVVHTAMKCMNRATAAESMLLSVGDNEEHLLSMIVNQSLDSYLRLAATKALDVIYSGSNPCLNMSILHKELSSSDEEENRQHYEEVTEIVFGSFIFRALHSTCRAKEPQASLDVLATILLFLLALQKIDSISQVHHSSSDPTLALVHVACTTYLRSSGILDAMMKILFRSGSLYPITMPATGITSATSPKKQKLKKMNIIELKDIYTLDTSQAEIIRLLGMEELDFGFPSLRTHSFSVCTNAEPMLNTVAAYCLRRTICSMPAVVRCWWFDDSPEIKGSLKERFQPFIEAYTSASIVSREIALIRIAYDAGRLDDPDIEGAKLEIHGNVASGEIKATYIRDEGESKVEILIRLPSSYPLALAEVECTRKIGIDETRWRRWQLQIVQLLSKQDGSVVDAIVMWKKNVDKEFEGIEACPICYCILHPKNGQLPKLTCPTCNNKFHSLCLNEWFKSSGKNKCVLCQQPFFV